LARARLANLTRGDLDDDPVLARIPPASTPAGFENHEPPADNVRVQKSMLLQNGGLTEFAIKELKAAASNGSAGWASMQMARFYQEGGRYDRALQVLKRAIPSYYSLGITQLPRPYWEALFPRPYWTELKKFSLQNDLDPFLVASLIRQESEFNPGAVSRAEALGLMQLLPATGKKVARELRVARFSAGELLSPNLNLQLGTRYFRNMINQFGKVEYALAAYNAGADRVQNWLASGNYRDTEEFVESIPFTETREYVQAIMRNAAVYRRLYGTP
jgi:soluble lytic murein transglycosylase